MISPELTSGLFDVATALVGGLFILSAARIGFRRSTARSNIINLCDQVAAYYELEKLYKVELENCDPKQRRAATILLDMRNRVAAENGNIYPKMTAKEASRIREKWS